MRPETVEVADELIREHARDEPPLLQQEFHRSLLAAFTPEEIEKQLAIAGLSHLEVNPVTDSHVDIRGRL
jgi:hypothetical protein